MFVSIFLFHLLAFFLLYNLSQKAKWKGKSPFLNRMEQQPRASRLYAFLLFLLGLGLLLWQLSWGSALAAAIFMLMAAGSVVVCFFPFRYFSLKSVLILYMLFFMLELFL